MKAAEKELSHEDSINIIIRLLHQAALEVQGHQVGFQTSAACDSFTNSSLQNLG